MPGILGPTNPVPGYTDAVKPAQVTPPQPGDTTIQNVVDPSRVVRPDGTPDQRQDHGNATDSGVARYESNFMTFLQRLRGSEEIPEIFLTMLELGGKEVASGIQSGFAEEIGQFLQFLKMDEPQLREFLRGQLQDASRFTDPLFQRLREAYRQSDSELMQREILRFVRRYSNYSSLPHLEDKMGREVTGMTESIPKRWAQPLSETLGRLLNSFAAGDREGALKLLRGGVFPLIGNYVNATHDHGLARSLLSMLSLDVARYENADEGELLGAMRRLSILGALPQEYATLSDKELLALLQNTRFYQSAAGRGAAEGAQARGEQNADPTGAKARLAEDIEAQASAFTGKIASLTHRALKGEAGPNVQEAFHNIMNSILINESVYMPLTHIMLPLDWNGNLVFSEMWVDPDADRNRPRAPGDNEPTTRLLIKMDIQSLGAFDVLLQTKGEHAVLAVRCPDAVAALSPAVTRALREILERNGLRADDVSVTAMRRPLTVSEVFPKIFEKMRGLNVRV